MITLNPYLNFPGNTEEAFNFYRSVFGEDFAGGIFRFKDTLEADKLNASDREKIMHVGLPLGKGTMLIATDALESMGHKVTAGNNFHLSIETESKDEADIIFNGLSAEGKVTIPMADMFWGAYFGMLTDKFGIQWMVSYTYSRENK